MTSRPTTRRTDAPAAARRRTHLDAFELGDLLEVCAAAEVPWLEFVRSADLSVGLYVLAAGAADLQSPHTEDEVYWIVAFGPAEGSLAATSP